MLSKKLEGATAAVTGYQIERSLRFNSADSTRLTRTFASAGNQKTWTWSGWVKRCDAPSGYSGALFTSATGSSDSTYGVIWFYDNKLRFQAYNTVYRISTAVYRDHSAWYHIVVALDTTQSTANDRIKMYVNGVQITAFDSTVNPGQNDDLAINRAVEHKIGEGDGFYSNIYLTEVNFINGQALTPSSFGETDSTTGVWKPKAFSGTYGTNGFYLKFADNSGTTSTTLGKDSSGNGNNWTPNNFSVTAGVGNDSLVDTPTPYGTDTGAGGEVRGNYATLNPIMAGATTTLSNGNLQHTAGATRNLSRSTIAMSSGKWFFEMTCSTNPGSGNHGCGIISSSNTTLGASYIGSTSDSYGYYGNAEKYNNGSGSSYGATFTNGDVIGVAFDADNGTLAFYKNGVSQGNAYTGLTGSYYFAVEVNTNGVVFANFGQRPFAYTAPSGFKALCTQNLPAPSVVQGDDYFNTVLYTGTGSTQSITGLDFQPDLVWIKPRSQAYHGAIYDTIRGTGKILYSSLTNAEDTYSNSLTAFNSNGFSLGADGSNTSNSNGTTHVAWTWRGSDSSAVSNTQGTITSTVSANTTSGFSVVTYTGTGANATVGHGLGATPGMIIIKSRSGAYNWAVWHTSLGGGDYALQLNTTIAKTNAYDYWNGDPNSTVFTLGTDAGANNSGSTYVAYCFAPVAGFSAFGKYEGTGTENGPFVYTGFRPAFVLLKASSAAYNWHIFDAKRNTYNVVTADLVPNSSAAEDTSNPLLDFTSNGFKLRTSAAGWNDSNTYIYAAFAENPFKHALAR